MTVLPTYDVNPNLEVGRQYCTIIIDNTFYPTNEEFKVINDTGQVRASAIVIDTKETDFDHLGFDDLKHSVNLHLQSWPNAAEYFSNKFGDLFRYDAPVQLVTFEVTSVINFDSPLIESEQDEKELGLPSDKELGLEENTEPAVEYTVGE